MLRYIILLVVPAAAFALGADATLADLSGFAAPYAFVPDDSQLVLLDSIASQSSYQCIYARNDTLFCALQASAVHLRDRLTGAIIDTFTTQSDQSACAICAFEDSICVSHLSGAEFCEVYTLDGEYVRSFYPTGGLQVRGLDWDGSHFWATSFSGDLSIYLMTRDGTVTKTLNRSGGFPSTIARDLALDPMYPNRLWSSPGTNTPYKLMYVAFDTSAGTFTPLDTFYTGRANYMAGIGFRNDSVDGGCVYVSTFTGSWMWRYKVHEPPTAVEEEPTVLPTGITFWVGPNPARSRVRISWSNASPADLSIFDANGRQVCSLRPGTGHAEWSLDDDRGRPVRSGVYFCRLSAGGATLSHKLVVRR